MKLAVFLAALAFTAEAEVLQNHYIVELSNDPVAKVAAQKHKRLLRADPELVAHHALVVDEQTRIRQRIETTGTQVLDSFQTVHNALVVRTDQSPQTLRAIPGVKSVRPVRIYQKLLDHSLKLQNVVDAWQQIGGIDQAGRGVKIGVIDTGIDITHPAFQDSGFTMPAGFPKVNNASDTAFTNNKVIVARSYTTSGSRKTSSANDIDGHGTGVAMIAAGGTNNGNHGPITGVAPQAWLGNYKVFPDGGSGAPDSLIIRAIEDAVNDGMDVMNLSLGSFPASRPADDNLVLAVENAVAAGKIVTISAGNEGSTPNTIGSPGIAPSAISVGSTRNDRIFAGHVIEDGHAPFTAIPGDGKNSSDLLTANVVDVSSQDPTGLACVGLATGSLNGAIALVSRGTCNFSVKLTNVQQAGAVAAIIYARPESPDAITMATSGASLPAIMVSNEDGMTLKNDAASGSLQVSVDFNPTAASVDAGRLSGFSSRGPNSDAGIKPDLLGIGENIYTAAPVGQGGWVVESGTSFSAPTVAGAAALLIGARPGLTAAQYRSLLVNSATTFPVGSPTPLGIQSAGGGILNMTATLSNTLAATPVSLSFGIGGGTLNQAKRLTITNVGATADTYSISVNSLGDGPTPSVSTNTLQLGPRQSGDVAVQFSADGLPGGVYQGYLQIQGTQSTVIERVPYWYAVPTQNAAYFQVLSSPSSAVRRGSTFDVEFRALDAGGVPVSDGIDPSIVSGADVVSIESSDADVPGAYTAHLRAPATRGTYSVQFTVGNATAPVSIQVN